MSSFITDRNRARRQALQLLFQSEAVGRNVEDILAGPYALDADDGPLMEYAEHLALNVDARTAVLDEILSSKAANWSLDRMNGVDRNLLRIALYEMLFEDEVDTAVAIDECVELAKVYGTDDSAPFVNGLLGAIDRDIVAGVDVVALAEEALAPTPVEVVEEAVEKAAEEALDAADADAEQDVVTAEEAAFDEDGDVVEEVVIEQVAADGDEF